MLPFTYDALAQRFATVRPWAKKAVGDATNRCAICMGYTLRLTPSEDDATIEKLADIASRVNTDAGPVGGARPLSTLSASFFIRAAELEPRVRRVYGEPDVQGVSKQVWRSVIGKKGVLYLEDCYQTEGDKSTSFLFFQRVNGDHWDLFNGINMVAEEYLLSGNSHEGQLYFWKAR